MTVQDTSPEIRYAGDGVTVTGFTFSFRTDDTNWIVVLVKDSGGTFTDITSTSVVTLNVDQSTSPGGDVDIQSAVPVGDDLIIRRDTPNDQTVDYQPYDPFPAETHENALDKLTMQTQEVQLALDNLLLGEIEGVATLAGNNIYTGINQFTGRVHTQSVDSTAVAAWTLRNHTGGVEWELLKNATDAGDGFLLERRNNGTFVDAPIAINHATGIVSMSNQLQLGDGDALNPGYAFISDSGMGMFAAGATALGFATEGVIRATITDLRARFLEVVQSVDGTVALPAFTFTSDPDTGMYLNAPGNLAIAADGVIQIDITNTRLQLSRKIFGTNGTVTEPSYSFQGNNDMGMYRAQADILGFAVGGAIALQLGNNGIFAGTGFRFQADGASPSAAAPDYTWSNDTDTGMYRFGANTIAFAVNGFGQVSIQPGSLGLWIDGTANASIEFHDTTGNLRWAIAHGGSAGFVPDDFVITRFNAAGAFLDNPFLINNSGIIVIATLPTSDPGLAGAMFRTGNDVQVSTG